MRDEGYEDNQLQEFDKDVHRLGGNVFLKPDKYSVKAQHS